jgi:fumarylacetoacetate (FAA) hydrolase
MKLATVRDLIPKNDNRDGELYVVSRDGKNAISAKDIAPCLRSAIETWTVCKNQLQELYVALNAGTARGSVATNTLKLHSPLPRSFQWADGSAFLHHVRLVRKARNAEPPETLTTVPLMYQGGSDCFLAPTEGIQQLDFSHGTDFEGELAVVVDDVPMGVSPVDALKHIQLVMLVNDVSLRGLIPAELLNGFGFLQSKPSSAFSPFAVTVDELGDEWQGGRLHLPLHVKLNGEFYGKANAGVMHFHFGDLIAHAAKTRNLAAGTIIGSGTVSEDKEGVGSSCLVEKRMIETIQNGKPTTPFMKPGDRIEIFMLNKDGENIFGTIDQKVIAAKFQ